MIRQFDVFENRSRTSGVRAPFVVVLQSHYLSVLATTVVCPLFRSDVISPGASLVFVRSHRGTSAHSGLGLPDNMPTRLLTRAVASLKDREDDIRHGLDRLFTGF